MVYQRVPPFLFIVHLVLNDGYNALANNFYVIVVAMRYGWLMISLGGGSGSGIFGFE